MVTLYAVYFAIYFISKKLFFKNIEIAEKFLFFAAENESHKSKFCSFKLINAFLEIIKQRFSDSTLA